VATIPESVDFFEAPVAHVLFCSRDGDWTLLQCQDTQRGLLAHPTGDGRFERVELHFTATSPVEEIEAHGEAANPGRIERGAGDDAFGRMLKLKRTDGLLIKIADFERRAVA
jgi:hypothetical protein